MAQQLDVVSSLACFLVMRYHGGPLGGFRYAYRGGLLIILLRDPTDGDLCGPRTCCKAVKAVLNLARTVRMSTTKD